MVCTPSFELPLLYQSIIWGISTINNNSACTLLYPHAHTELTGFPTSMIAKKQHILTKFKPVGCYPFFFKKKSLNLLFRSDMFRYQKKYPPFKSMIPAVNTDRTQPTEHRRHTPSIPNVLNSIYMIAKSVTTGQKGLHLPLQNIHAPISVNLDFHARGGWLLLCSSVPWAWSGGGPSRRGWSSASPPPLRAQSVRWSECECRGGSPPLWCALLLRSHPSRASGTTNR